MQTKTYNVYKFEELSDKAKEKAIDNLRDINVDYKWWDSIYEDAANIGLRITSFDLAPLRYATGEFMTLGQGEQCAGLIMKEHGEMCDTYKLAAAYIAELEKVNAKYPNHGDADHEDYEAHHEETGLLEDKFLSDLLEDYSLTLQKEYEYLQEDSAVIETILANAYDFTEDGKID
jgi:hypothetical protein